jgi:hypothetical protein
MEPTSRQSHTTSSGLELSESIEKARDLPPLSSFPLSQAEPYSKDYEMIANRDMGIDNGHTGRALTVSGNVQVRPLVHYHLPSIAF